MKTCQVIKLLLHALYGTLLTTCYIAREFFYLIFSRSQKSVKDEIILVTGAGHGLGRRMAISLSRLGAIVVCWDYNTETNTNTVWDIRHEGGRAHGYTCDVRDRSAVLETADKVVKEVGPVTMLVNNAGIYPVKAILDFTPAEIKDIFDTNLMAHFWTLKAFLPGMIERNHGHVLTISSAASLAPVANEVVYSASKCAVTGLMDGMMQELRRIPNNKVKVTCVHPYYTAVRDDIPVKFDLRIERMSPDYVVAEIIKGFRQNREMISVPGFMYFWICFVKCLPKAARIMWREDVFYTRVYPTDGEVQVKMEATVEDKFRCAEKIIGDEMAPPNTPMGMNQIDLENNVTSVQSSTDKKNMMNAMAAPEKEAVVEETRVMNVESQRIEKPTAPADTNEDEMTQI